MLRSDKRVVAVAKRLVLLLGVVFALTSCEKVDISDYLGGATSEEETAKTKAFTFHVKGDFLTNYEEMGTRASVRLEDENTAGVTDLWVLDYDADGTLLQQVHQSSTDADFGHPQMNLTYGHHDVKFIASKGTDAVLTATALSWGRVKDTFVLDYAVDVVASSNGNRAPELKRAVGGIALVNTDAVPADAKEIQITAKRSLALALPSLAVTDAAESTVTMTFPANWVGSVNNTMSTYTLVGDEDLTTDVSVKVVATDGSTISEFTIEDVVVRKNRMTTLKGEVFGRGSGFSVSIDDAWESPLEVTF